MHLIHNHVKLKTPRYSNLCDASGKWLRPCYGTDISHTVVKVGFEGVERPCYMLVTCCVLTPEEDKKKVHNGRNAREMLIVRLLCERSAFAELRVHSVMSSTLI